MKRDMSMMNTNSKESKQTIVDFMIENSSKFEWKNGDIKKEEENNQND